MEHSVTQTSLEKITCKESSTLNAKLKKFEINKKMFEDNMNVSKLHIHTK